MKKMQYNFTVKIPTETKKIAFQKQKDVVYVLYETERLYSPAKKYTYPKRTMIGRRCPEDPELMYPNDNFFIYFPGQAMPEEHDQVERSCCLKIGNYIVIKQILQEQGLDQILLDRFGSQAGLFQDFVSYLIVEEDNAAQHYPDYAYNHPLFTVGMRVLSDSTISKLLKETSEEQIQGVLDDWNAKQDKKERIYISYDSTNKNSQAGDIDILEFGKAKDEKGLPIFNLSLAFNCTNEKPLFYEQYPGSINDVSQFKFVVDKALEYGYRRIGFILDRGYFSKSNIQYMDDNGYAFVMMVKGCKTLVRGLIDEVRGTFETDRQFNIRHHHLNAITLQRPLFSAEKKLRYIHLYFSHQKMADDRAEIEDKLEEMMAEYQKYVGKEVNFSEEHERYFDFHFDKQGRFQFASEKVEVIQKELEWCGYFAIVTSEKMSAEDAYCLYKGRDSSEKLFRADKTFLGCKSMRVASLKAMSTKMLLEFIALIVRNRMYVLLRDETKKLSARKNFMTVPAAIRELEKIEMVRLSNSHYRLDHAVTRTQQTILNAFGISVEDIREQAAQIAQAVAVNQ